MIQQGETKFRVWSLIFLLICFNKVLLLKCDLMIEPKIYEGREKEKRGGN